MNINEIRKDFPVLNRKINNKPSVYLDSAATSQKPIQVIEAVSDFYKNHNANIHRGVHQLSQEASRIYETSHKKTSDFINCGFDELIFVRNATEGINLVMYAWALDNLKPGDEIISTVMEHHANIVPWQFLQKKGVVLKYADIDRDGCLDLDDLKKKITHNTRLVAFAHASNVLGTINPVKEIAQIAHENNALVLVDAAQSAPHMKIDFKEMGADFLVFSGHKMLAPTGIGGLAVKKSILEKMRPFMYGGDMIRNVTLNNSTFNDLPWRFEAGTPDIAGAAGLSAAIDYLENIGTDKIREHEIEITGYAIDKLKKIGISVYGPSDPKNRAGLISFNIKSIHPHDVAGILDSEYNVMIRSGHHCAQPLINRLNEHSSNRASFYIYTTKQEIDMLAQGLKKVIRVFQR